MKKRITVFIAKHHSWLIPLFMTITLLVLSFLPTAKSNLFLALAAISTITTFYGIKIHLGSKNKLKT
jgi:hypothetical protein